MFLIDDKIGCEYPVNGIDLYITVNDKKFKVYDVSFDDKIAYAATEDGHKAWYSFDEVEFHTEEEE